MGSVVMSEAGGLAATATRVERRCFVALLFSDLSDYTALGESTDPEEVIELRQEAERLARQVMLENRGEINQFTGDGILAVFGLAQPDEDAVRHAIDASLALHDAVRATDLRPRGATGFQVRFHSGVHSGLVFARSGDPLHGKYELTGDTVNTAARLCSAAKKDEVLVSASALAGWEVFYRVEPVPGLLLKGKQNPINAYRVVGRSHVRTRLDARPLEGATPFVGRVEIVESLDGLMMHARSGRGTTWCLVGDAGVGKTRLCDEMAARARAAGLCVRRGSCERYGGVVPLRPFLQITAEALSVPPGATEPRALAALEAQLNGLDPKLCSHIPAFLHLLSIKPWSAGAPGDDSPPAFITALTQLMTALATASPTLVLLDDWQWADSGSTQVLARLMRVAEALPLFILVAARDVPSDDPVLGQAPVLQLQPFTEGESLDVVRSLTRPDIDRTAAQRLHLRAGGNPLFLEELCRSVPRSAEGPKAFGSANIPSTLQGLIHARVERLKPEHAQALRIASVIGNDFSASVLREFVRDSNLDSTLAALVQTGLIVTGAEEQSYRFKHGITREVTYESVRLNERRLIHAQVARALEDRAGKSGLVDHYEVLASHYAGATDWHRAMEFSDLAGNKAALASALDSARAQYAAALSHADQLPLNDELRRRWLGIVARWARVCIFSPARDQLSTLARAIEYAEALDDSSQVAYVEHWIGWLQYALGDQEAAVRHGSRALELAERANDPPLVAQILANLGQSHAASGAYDSALEHLSRSIDLKRTRGSLGHKGTVPVGFAYALGCRALVEGDRGDFVAARAQLQEAFELIRDTGHAVEGSLWCLLGMLQLWQGRWHDALHTASIGRATAERINGPYVHALQRLLGNYARWVLERSATALTEVRAAVDWLDRREIRLYLSFGLGHLAEGLFDAGELKLSREYANKALVRARQSDPIGLAMAQRTLARLALAAGDAEQAREHGQSAHFSAEARGSERELALAWLTLADVELALGHRTAAVPMIEQACERFERMQMSWHLAEARRRLATS